MNNTHIFNITGARTQTTNTRNIFFSYVKITRKVDFIVELEIIQAKHRVIKINVMCEGILFLLSEI